MAIFNVNFFIILITIYRKDCSMSLYLLVLSLTWKFSTRFICQCPSLTWRMSWNPRSITRVWTTSISDSASAKSEAATWLLLSAFALTSYALFFCFLFKSSIFSSSIFSLTYFSRTWILARGKCGTIFAWLVLRSASGMSISCPKRCANSPSKWVACLTYYLHFFIFVWFFIMIVGSRLCLLVQEFEDNPRSPSTSG